MKVLHVSLGLPPLRTGGLTRYSVELMEAQAAAGDEVALLFPGRFLRGKTRIAEGLWKGISTFEIVNPLPVALTYGVAEPRAFMAKCDAPEEYDSFLERLDPDVIHVHSYQGVHREFFEAAKAKGIPIVLTTHDYYSICPRATLVDRAGASCDGPSSEKCASCCYGVGMTMKKSRIMQSRLYARLKDSRALRAVAGKVKRGMSLGGDGPSKEGKTVDSRAIESFGALLEYNASILSMVDLVASNSALTERIYRVYFPDAKFRLVPGTHAGLVRSERSGSRRKDVDKPKIAYLGGMKPYKGYGTLLAACGALHDEGVAFQLDLYGDEYEQPQGLPEVVCGGRVPPDETRDILRAHDVVVVPSICHETCGFVVLEALCEGVRVVCSDAVGASELVERSFVFDAGDFSDLTKKLSKACYSLNNVAQIPDSYPLSLHAQVDALKRAYCDLAEEGGKGQGLY